ncbi:hypothetical protein B0H65DRAFT_551636 [Neurospora tetraspora]|uniref:Uncharacterized protein n=1 Tax=Neurospora tetraspora TaxID=94610 RepID=A0AAE0MPL9_9PEZI|nr:hypothetical protein B0H65DRAFT_551636 [Neurospora tetraspora]
MLCQAGINSHEIGNNIQAWDLQAWSPFRIPFNNGKNNVAQLLAFLRLTVMKSGEWIAWFDDKIDLTPISVDWLDMTIYKHNIN